MTRLSILCNDKAKEGYFSEHGFSVLIEKDSYKLIFDTGTTDIFLKNLQKLSKDINEIDNIVISHGHYDHLGGIRELGQFNKTFSIWVKEGIFIPKYSLERFIGVKTENISKNLNFKFIKEDFIEIFPNIYLFGPSPMINNFESIDDTFYIKSEKGDEKDKFKEEMNLVIDEGDLILITGCAHRGIANIINHAKSLFKKDIKVVLGGFHLYNASKEKLENIVKYFNSVKIKTLIPCHCTGDRTINFFEEKFYGEIIECLAGDKFDL